MTLKQLTIFIFCLLLSISVTAQSFEGVITADYYNANSDSRSEIKWYLAPGKVALQMVMDSEKGQYTTTFIARQGADQLDVLSKTASGEKLHHPIPTEDIQPPDNFPAVGSLEAKEQEETKTVAGYKCAKVAGQSPESKTIAWVAKDIDFPFYEYAAFFQSDYNLALLDKLQINGIPLQSVTTTNRGLIIESVEVTDVTEKSLNSSVFEVPADYQTIEKAKVEGRE